METNSKETERQECLVQPLITRNGDAVFGVDPCTGEVSDWVEICIPSGSRITTPAQQKVRREWLELQNEQALREAVQTARKNALSRLGTHIRAEFDRDAPVGQLDSAFMARLVFLASFMDNDKSIWVTQRRLMTKKDAQELLGLSKSVFYSFWNEAVLRGYIHEDEEALRIATPMFCRGKSVPTGYSRGWIRIYCNQYQKLYKSVRPTQHTYIGAILRMMPFINIEYNVLCKNPLVTDVDEIEPITLVEMCTILGLTADNAKHYRKKCESIVLPTSEGDMKFCTTVKSDDGVELVYVNPRILYAGSNADYVEGLKLFFPNPGKA